MSIGESGSELSLAVAHEEPASRCPLCGEAIAPRADRCARCGGVVGDAGEWRHPLVEWAPDPAARERPGTFRLGLLPATIGAIAFRPRRTFSQFRWHGGIARPVLAAMLVLGPSLAWTWLASNVSSDARAPGAGGLLVFVALLVGAAPVWVYLKAQAAQLVLVLFGAVRRPFESTFRGVGYSSASVGWLWLVPVVGGVAFALCSAFLEGLAIRAAHGCSLGVAFTATFGPWLALGIAIAARFGVDLMFLPA